MNAFLVLCLLWNGQTQPTPGTVKSPPAHGIRIVEIKPRPITDAQFRIYDSKGATVTFDQILRRMLESDVILVGENHDDPVAHHLQLRLLRQLCETQAKAGNPSRPVALSLEMFERDVQHVLNEYLAGLITEEHFLQSSRPWNNYKSDYRPLVEYAREHKLAVVAANAPRRYVNRVGRLGPESLKDIGDPQSRGLPPLPYAPASSAYAARFNALMEKMKPEKTKEKPPPAAAKPQAPDPARMLAAQSLWDATMAFSIAEHLKRVPQAQVIHLNGGFHSEKRLGITEHLLRYRPGTGVLTIAMVSNKSFPKFDPKEMVELGDFVIVTDPSAKP